MKSADKLVMICAGILLVSIGIFSSARPTRQQAPNEKLKLIRSIQDSLHKLELLESTPNP